MTIILTVYFIAIISAFFLTKKYQLTLNEKDFEFMNFLNFFFKHFWYLFVIWIVGFSKISKIFVYFIIYFKGLTIGILIKNLIKLKFTLLMAIITLDFIMIFPLLIVLANASLSFSKINNQSLYVTKKYEKLIYITLLITLIYSFLLEMVGGIYG